MSKTPVTRQILSDYFNFDITDLGDFWRAQKGSFALIQPKSEVIEYEFSFYHLLEDKEVYLINDRAINTVEDLQKLCLENNIELKFTM